MSFSRLLANLPHSITERRAVFRDIIEIWLIEYDDDEEDEDNKQVHVESEPTP